MWFSGTFHRDVESGQRTDEGEQAEGGSDSEREEEEDEDKEEAEEDDRHET